jgi:hypothetical protein
VKKPGHWAGHISFDDGRVAGNLTGSLVLARHLNSFIGIRHREMANITMLSSKGNSPMYFRNALFNRSILFNHCVDFLDGTGIMGTRYSNLT